MSDQNPYLDGISRRFFLLGLTSAIATESLLMKGPVIPVPAKQFYLHRRIHGLSWMCNSDKPQMVTLFRGDIPLLQSSVGPGGMYFWRAELDGLILLKDHVLRLMVEGESKETVIELDVSDYVDDGPPIRLTERHTIIGQLSKVDTFFMELDNSRAARNARELVKRQARAWLTPATATNPYWEYAQSTGTNRYLDEEYEEVAEKVEEEPDKHLPWPQRDLDL